MSLPTTSDISTLAFVSEGQPCATFQPSTADTTTLAFVFAGQPFYAHGAGAAAPTVARPVVFCCT